MTGVLIHLLPDSAYSFKVHDIQKHSSCFCPEVINASIAEVQVQIEFVRSRIVHGVNGNELDSRKP